MGHFSLRTAMPVDRLSLFQWHLQKSSFERMIPPWINLSCCGRLPEPSDLNVPFEIVLKKGLMKARITLAHSQFIWGQLFADEQWKGPFKSWHHVHRFLQGEGGGSFLEDEIDYDLGGGLEGYVTTKIKRAFQYRHETLSSDLAFLKLYPEKKLKILISGATGFIGSMLKAFLGSAGHDVWTLHRSESLLERQIFWEPSRGQLQTGDLEGFDAIIHLGGASLGSLIWSEEVKKQISLSRVHSTWLLAKAISRLKRPPEVFMFASGIGYYGSSFSGVDESSPKGSGFMSDLAADIEASSETARGACRVVPLRLAAVLSMQGGYLARMLPMAACYARLSTGNPNRKVAWVDREDVLRAIYHILLNPSLHGPVNVVAPQETTEERFWDELGKSMGKKFLLPLPSSWMKVISPILYRELLAADQGKISSKLSRSSLPFRNPELHEAFKYCSEY